eukprot:9067705-Lingulodinium_polyedra.AAC.1
MLLWHQRAQREYPFFQYVALGAPQSLSGGLWAQRAGGSRGRRCQCRWFGTAVAGESPVAGGVHWPIRSAVDRQGQRFPAPDVVG